MIKKKLVDQIELEKITPEIERKKKVASTSTLSDAVLVERPRVRQRSFVMDLCIHSPSALGYMGIEGMDSAPALVRLARVKGINVIGITDYNSGAYIDRVRGAVQGSEVNMFPGVTLRCSVKSCDEVMLCALFSETTTSADIRYLLETLEVPPSAQGRNAHVIKKELTEVIRIVEDRGGILFPSRMDKTPHRLSILTALVEEYGFRTFDIAYTDSNKIFKKLWPKKKFNLFSFSEAHALAQIGSRASKIKLPEMSFDSLARVFQREESETSAPLIVEQEELELSAD